eukprot:CAMPEP_0115270246 /NCGR_PEP_ID=MMETSP0270-20121206/53469_1 /TAXON_ID=71861 /ORGANISM="Scrippsiella trochoidea, Strain CCMP3099" /LENGTH=300 /DNA_ID=CAMNT_0002686537 /DNA_START=562 /DNA_END=1464 /DNA_ORIENTATION=-
MLYALLALRHVGAVANLAAHAILVLSIVAIQATILALLARAISSESPTSFTPVAAVLHRAGCAALVLTLDTSRIRSFAVAFLALLALRHIRVAGLAVKHPALEACTSGVHTEARLAAAVATSLVAFAAEAIQRAGVTMASLGDVPPMSQASQRPGPVWLQSRQPSAHTVVTKRAETAGYGVKANVRGVLRGDIHVVRDAVQLHIVDRERGAEGQRPQVQLLVVAQRQVIVCGVSVLLKPVLRLHAHGVDVASLEAKVIDRPSMICSGDGSRCWPASATQKTRGTSGCRPFWGKVPSSMTL